jgi:hypothetical protein
VGPRVTNAPGYEQFGLRTNFPSKKTPRVANGVSGYEHNLATAASGKPRVSARESVPSAVWLSARCWLNVPCLLLNFIVFCVVNFRLYFICLVLCSSFFVLDLVIFIGFVYEYVYKVL